MAANVNEVRGGGCFVVAFDVALDAEDIAIAYHTTIPSPLGTMPMPFNSNSNSRFRCTASTSSSFFKYDAPWLHYNNNTTNNSGNNTNGNSTANTTPSIYKNLANTNTNTNDHGRHR